MAHDIVIRGGQIVDGTGNEPTPGDLAIDDGVALRFANAAADADDSGRAFASLTDRLR